MTRREFVAVSAMALQPRKKPMLCVFSKHLADIAPLEVGKAAKSLGFEGVDLTVRPKGHVPPETVSRNLAPVVDAIRNAGLEVPMITTDLTSTADPAARTTLEAMKRLKIPLWKVGYWRGQTLEQVRPKAQGLFGLSKEFGLIAGLHNHSGDYFGSVPYEYEQLLAGVPPEVAGYYFDPAHAFIEGGLHGWRVFTRLATARLRMVALKDFVWEKKNGKWDVAWCPLGQGMVNWTAIFKSFKDAGFTGPISLHVEYVTGDEKPALAKDLEFMRKVVAQAYGS